MEALVVNEVGAFGRFCASQCDGFGDDDVRVNVDGPYALAADHHVPPLGRCAALRS